VPSSSQWKVAFAWLLAAAWAAVIWTLGGDAFASPETSRIFGPLIDWLLPELTPRDRFRLLSLLRKAAHLFEYAVFAVLLLRAFSLSWRRSLQLATVFSLGAVFALALADEARQGQSGVRTGSGFDVALDVAGGALAVGLWLVLVRLRAARRRTPGAS